VPGIHHLHQVQELVIGRQESTPSVLANHWPRYFGKDMMVDESATSTSISSPFPSSADVVDIGNFESLGANSSMVECSLGDRGRDI
jgi:hypothetical protein